MHVSRIAPNRLAALPAHMHDPRALLVALQQKQGRVATPQLCPVSAFVAPGTSAFLAAFMGNPAMFESLSFAAAARLVRSFGGQVAMSVAVSGAVAAVFAAPEFLFGRGGPALVAIAPVEGPQESVWLALAAVDGKIRDRHRGATEAEAGSLTHGTFLATPASLAMPMSTGWPQPVFSEPTRSVAGTAGTVMRVSLVEAAPARRAVVAAERTKPAPATQALPVAPAVATSVTPVAEPEAPQPAPSLLGRVVLQPVARAANVVSGAAGMVGSAGVWTVSQASSLLPRW
jgi:hypothetical protein